MIELIYLLSDFQCGANAQQAVISANIYRNGALVASNVNKGDKILLEDMNGVTINYSFQNGSCALSPVSLILGKNDPVPNLAGAYGQASLQAQLNGLNTYEQLYLVSIMPLRKIELVIISATIPKMISKFDRFFFILDFYLTKNDNIPIFNYF